jgi:hypothetical protein
VTEQAQPPQTLTERALARLRKIATGNGLEPAAVVVIEPQEQDFVLQGTMEVSPLCEVESGSYAGGVRGKDRKIVENFAALSEAVAKHKQEFRENFDWIDATIEELQTHEGQGWGLENAKVTLPKKSAIYAASENCPNCGGQKMVTCTQCNGQGTVICTQCQGQGRELCYYCGGRGEDPQQPGQKCHTCDGTRYAPCRFCKSHRYLPCPTCNGLRGTPCPTCQAQGRTTQEVVVTCGAETHFKLATEGLPSGLRRGLDRIGIVNLSKGHADIEASKPDKAEGQEQGEEKPKEGAPIPILTYKATLPYAEMRMGFGGKKAIISAVGKRCAINGVPNFLDDSLKPWSDKLHEAALGNGPLEKAIEMRALKEILSLTVAGKGRPEEVRKLYPFGLSSQAITTFLFDTQLALNKTTLNTRATIAVLSVVLSAVFFYVFFHLGLEAHFTLGLNRFIGMAISLIALGAVLAVSWALLNFSTRFVLSRRFPQLRIGLQQKIGKTGYAMLGGVFAAFLILLFSAPVKPLWLALLMH